MKRTVKSLCPAALVLFAVTMLGGCSTAPIQTGEMLEAPLFPPERILGEDVTYVADVYDPWEGFNRTMYRFNYGFDKYVFLPAVGAYQTITPDVAEKGIHNFFTNIKSITTLINSVLQLSLRKTFETTGRFVVNTTLGIAGLFDVATALGMPEHQEDFGQTLGRWGVGNGPYLVLPVFGPSNLRDGVGLGVDAYVSNEIRDEALDLETWQEWTWNILFAIDTRANIAFRYYETGSPVEYEMVRMLYTTKRQLDVER